MVNKRETMHDPNDSIFEESESSRKPRSLTWKSCLLLFVLSLGIMAAPLAVIYRWSVQQQSDDQVTRSPAEQIDNGRDRSPSPAPSTSGIETTVEIVNQIAYITRDQQLGVIFPDGSGGRLLTNLERRYDFPAWAPDGSSIAVTAEDGLYVVSDIGQENGPAELRPIYLSDIQPPFYLYWAPDSSHVSFLANHPQGIGLHLVQVNGETDDQLLATGQPFYWDWSPAGDQILIHTGLSGPDAKLTFLDPKNNEVGSNIADPGFFQAPGISPSGSYLAYGGLDEDGLSQIEIQDNNGLTVFFEPHIGQAALSWSPIADLLAYTSPSFDSNSLYGPLRLLNPVTGESHTITQLNVLAFFWSPNGRTIAYLTLPNQDDGTIQVAFLPTQISSGKDLPIQQVGGSLELWTVNIETGFQRRLTNFLPSDTFAHRFLPYYDQYALSHRLWSPDSNAMILPMVEGGVSHIVVVSTETGSMQILTDGEIGFWSHQ